MSSSTLFLRFCSKCYQLEGDGFLAPRVYDHIAELNGHCDILNAPLLHARAVTIANQAGPAEPAVMDARIQQHVESGLVAIRPSIKYFKDKFWLLRHLWQML